MNKKKRERRGKQWRRLLKYKNIVVPIELEHAERAKAMLDEAKKFVDKGGRVTVVNVVPDVPGLITAGLPDARCPAAILAPGPKPGTQGAAAVERKGRHHVECYQQPIEHDHGKTNVV